MNTQSFDDAFDKLMKNEGGFSSTPDDPGNWSSGQLGVGTLDGTMWGISAPVARRNGYTGPMKDLPQETAKAIARTEYWDPVRGDELPPLLASEVLDGAYNTTPTESIKWLQQAVGVAVDGHFGTLTMNAVRSIPDVYRLILRYDAQRMFFLANAKGWPNFGRGWARRIATNMMRAAQ